MAAAMLCFFIVFFATLFGRKEHVSPRCALPRRRRITTKTWVLVRNFTPWVVAAIVLLVVAYVPPLYEVITGPTQSAPAAFGPSSPVPLP